MTKTKSIYLALLAILLSPMAANADPIYADTVDSFTGGSGFGVIDQSGGTYGGASGSGVFDASAITDGLDGASLGLGGQTDTAGQIVVSFSTGAVLDGAGADVIFYDTFGISEGISVEASLDGLIYSLIGSFGGDISTRCSPGIPCGTGFDLASAGLASAAFFRATVVQRNISTGGGCVRSYPECYDLDAVEAVYFGAVSVPEPGTLALFGIGLLGMGATRRRKKA